jgi:hypothetical protein
MSDRFSLVSIKSRTSRVLDLIDEVTGDLAGVCEWLKRRDMWQQTLKRKSIKCHAEVDIVVEIIYALVAGSW